MGLLLDTGFLYGLIDEDDSYHIRSVELLKKLKWEDLYPIVTTSLVVNETYTVLLYRTRGNTKLLKNLDNLFWGEECFFRIIDMSSSEFQKISQIMAKYSSSKKLLSFVDSSLIYVAQKTGYDRLISFDTHFDGILTRIY